MNDKLVKQLVEALDLDEFTEGYRRRLRILDSQIEAFDKLKESFEQKLVDMVEVINHLRTVCNACSRLNILCTNVGGERKAEGPQDDTEKDISEKLTDWH